jgi:hypothetical protein
LVGRPSGIRTQSGQTEVQVSTNLREARAVPRLVSYTLAFALQLGKITENPSQGIRETARWPSLGRVCQASQPAGSPHQLTSSLF